MRGHQLLLPVKSFATNAVRLLSWCLSQSANNTSLPSLNSLPVPAADNGLLYEQYSGAVQQLRPLFPPNCTSFEVDEVKAVNDIPLEAGGYADIWEATLYDCNVIQKSYRRYETSDIQSIFRVRNDVFYHCDG